MYIFEQGEAGNECCTYKDRYQNSNKIARLLLDNGIDKGDTFAVFMKNYPEYGYALLAGITIGAIMVPIDPRSRGDKLKFLLHNCNARVVIVEDELLSTLEEVLPDLPAIKLISIVYKKGHTIPVNNKFQALNEVLESNIWKTVDQMMQIIYTSGTTGDPEGVAIRNNRTGLFHILNSIVWKYQKDDILYNGLSLTHGKVSVYIL